MPWDRRLGRPSVRAAAAVDRTQSRYAEPAGPAGSTRSRLRSPGPRPGGSPQERIRRSRRLFSQVLGVGAGDPAPGLLPAGPSRLRAVRIVSSETRSAARPSAKLTSAATSSRDASRRAELGRALVQQGAQPLPDRCIELGARRLEPRLPGVSAASPERAKAAIAFRTVWLSRPSSRVIALVCSPRARASRSWQRRSTATSLERKPASRRARSSSVRGRTKIGALMCPGTHDLVLSPKRLD